MVLIVGPTYKVGFEDNICPLFAIIHNLLNIIN